MLELPSVQKLHQQGYRPAWGSIAMFDHADLTGADTQEAGEFGLTVPAPLPDRLECRGVHRLFSDLRRIDRGPELHRLLGAALPDALGFPFGGDGEIVSGGERMALRVIGAEHVGAADVLQDIHGGPSTVVGLAARDNPHINVTDVRGLGKNRIVDELAVDADDGEVAENGVTRLIVGEPDLELRLAANGDLFNDGPENPAGTPDFASDVRHLVSPLDAPLIAALCSYVNTGNTHSANYF